MLADTFNCEVKTVVSKEGPALGVAILAGVAPGFIRVWRKAAVPSSAPIRPRLLWQKMCPNMKSSIKSIASLYPALKDSYKALAQL